MLETQSMSMEIDDKIRSITTRCLNDFECLKVNNAPCLNATVERWIDGKVLFVNCKDNCNYKMKFGDICVCNCPTRNEIYRKYSR